MGCSIAKRRCENYKNISFAQPVDISPKAKGGGGAKGERHETRGGGNRHRRKDNNQSLQFNNFLTLDGPLDYLPGPHYVVHQAKAAIERRHRDQIPLQPLARFLKVCSSLLKGAICCCLDHFFLIVGWWVGWLNNFSCARRTPCSFMLQ